MILITFDKHIKKAKKYKGVHLFLTFL